MAIGDDLEIQRLLALHRAAQQRMLHYHVKMWEAAKFFFWAFSVVLSASSLVMLQLPRVIDVVALPLIWIALGVLTYGRRVLIQERGLFAYYLCVTRRIEDALGWELRYPVVQQLTPARSPFHTLATPDLQYETRDALSLANGSSKIRLSGEDFAEIASVPRLKTGAYGVMMLLFGVAWWGGIVMHGLYAYWYYWKYVLLPVSG